MATFMLQSAYGYGKSLFKYLRTNKQIQEHIVPSTVTSAKKRISRGYLYAFPVNDGIYKVGKTIDMKKRMRSYRTLHPDNVTLHTIFCEDIHNAEKVLHSMLKMQGYHVKQELFHIPSKLLIEYMNIVSNISKRMSKDGKDAAKLSKFNRALETIK